MSSILERAAAPEAEPLICTIVGTAGSGKTSLAAMFPNPIFLQTQGEAIPKDVPGKPTRLKINNTDDLWEALKALLKDDHSYQTLVLDTVTGQEQLFVAEILANDPKARGINQAMGGYGAGPAAVMAMHARVRNAAEYLRERRGMNTVFLAHADIARIDPPDSDGYSQYTLRLPGKSIAPFVDNVDLVGFIKQTAIVRGAVEGSKDRASAPGKAITDGERVLVTYMTPATVAKNRLGIEEDLPFVKGQNPLAPYIVSNEPAPSRRRRKPEAAPDTVAKEEVENEA